MDKRMKGDGTLAVPAVLLTNLIFGFSFMASRIALEHTTASIMLMLRFGVSVVVMLAMIILRLVRFEMRGKSLKNLLLLGIIHPVIYFVGESNGIKYSNSSFAGIMIALIPVVTAILSGPMLHERLSKSTYGWIMCSVAGVAVISMAQAGEGAVQSRGVLYLLLAVFAGSIFVILSRSLSGAFSPFERTFVMMVTGFIFYAGAAAAQEGSGFFETLGEAVSDRMVLVPILYLSLISSIMAFMLQNYALTYLDAARVAVFSNIVPVVSVVAGVLLLGEPFSAAFLLGIILILAGVYKVNTLATGAKQGDDH